MSPSEGWDLHRPHAKITKVQAFAGTHGEAKGLREGFVYILTNRKDGTLYIGVTNDLARRLEQHRSGVIPGFAKTYNCQKLVWFERHDDIHSARIAEKRMKAWKRAWKVKRIEENNPRWDDISGSII